jgi:uncharacterized membrane protein YqjE
MATPGHGTGTPPSPPSLIQSIKGYLATWIDLLKTRLELFSTEWHEEQYRLQGILIWGLAALLCVSFGVFLVTLFVVVIFWDTPYRLIVLGAMALLYLVVGLIVAAITWRKSREKPKLFSATIGELGKDYRNLTT